MPWDQHKDSESAEIRARLKHPVIDGDGHVVEYQPLIFDYVEKVAGPKVTARLRRQIEGGEPGSDGGRAGWYGYTPEQRDDMRIYRPPFFMVPSKNTVDRATAMLPALFRKRLDEFGIDFAIVYTSNFRLQKLRDDELRQAGCRGLNLMLKELFAPYADRMTPAAVIPMVTPEEAVAELDFAVGELGMKAAMTTAYVPRPVPRIAREAPELAPYAQWIDPLALGSPFDYDPVWAKCMELKVAPTAHSTGFFGARASTVNYVYNHIGNFGAAGEAFCKALVIGGVTARFPDLKFAFLEGGVGWACSLYNDLFEHWQKRNINAMDEHLHPKNVDKALFAELVEAYGGKAFADHVERMCEDLGERRHTETAADLDEWRDCPARSMEELRDLFIPNFYFGCEADDRMVAAAFSGKLNRFGAKLKAIFSSDVGHWDVPDMAEVLAESYELVSEDLITEDDFHAFTFANAAELHASMNPDFFKGTVIEKDVEKLMAGA
ncbi:MAG: amidohydrolase family protein [Alphaproteobacteria bacterium]|nr:amidohydrolase family protein [Alphaproteobacteria bacterium]